MKKITIKRRLGTIAHYIGVSGEFFVVIFFALWFNNILNIPSLFIVPFRIFGIILAAFGLFLIVWCCWLQFKIGQGTTGFSEPTINLVTSGPYEVVRNSMMEGQFLFFAGIGFLLDLVAMFIILPILILSIHGFIVFIEEPNLRRRFGQKYIDYCKNVPRWFPRFRKTKNNINMK